MSFLMIWAHLRKRSQDSLPSQIHQLSKWLHFHLNISKRHILYCSIVSDICAKIIARPGMLITFQLTHWLVHWQMSESQGIVDFLSDHLWPESDFPFGDMRAVSQPPQSARLTDRLTNQRRTERGCTSKGVHKPSYFAFEHDVCCASFRMKGRPVPWLFGIHFRKSISICHPRPVLKSPKYWCVQNKAMRVISDWQLKYWFLWRT